MSHILSQLTPDLRLQRWVASVAMMVCMQHGDPALGNALEQGGYRIDVVTFGSTMMNASEKSLASLSAPDTVEVSRRYFSTAAEAIAASSQAMVIQASRLSPASGRVGLEVIEQKTGAAIPLADAYPTWNALVQKNNLLGGSPALVTVPRAWVYAEPTTSLPSMKRTIAMITPKTPIAIFDRSESCDVAHCQAWALVVFGANAVRSGWIPLAHILDGETAIVSPRGGAIAVFRIYSRNLDTLHAYGDIWVLDFGLTPHQIKNISWRVLSIQDDRRPTLHWLNHQLYFRLGGELVDRFNVAGEWFKE